MNDTIPPPPGAAGATPPPQDGFEASRLRTVTDMRRSSSDRLVAGVCAGLGRYLNVDPVVIRVLAAVLTLVGGAGLILYLAAWFLLPADDASRSIAGDWFNLGDNEDRVRVGGLVIALVIAVLAVVGDSGWGWGAGFPWWLIAPALLIYVFAVRPNRRRDRAAAATAVSDDTVPFSTTTSSGWSDEVYQSDRPTVREPKSKALLGLTVSVAAIALAVTRLVTAGDDRSTPWTTYVLVALAVVGVGLLIGTLWGHAGALIPIGLLLTLVLAIGSAVPDLRVGQQLLTPTSAAEVQREYSHGVGELRLDLTDVSDPDDLLGRTVTLDSGIGKSMVVVPDGLDVQVRSELSMGEIKVFDKRENGTALELVDPPTVSAGSAADRLTLVIDHRIGQIEVISE